MVRATTFLLLSFLGLALAHHEEFGLGEEFADVGEILHKLNKPNPDPFRNIYPNWIPAPADIRDSGSPLILNGKDPEVVKKEARVTGPLGDVEGYSGYLLVEPKHNSSLFFWYFPSKKGVENSPLVVWLQGGPGATSLFGLFTEMGPYEVVGSKLQERKYSWHHNYSLLFIDSPVGTGFSYTDSEDGYCRNQDQIAKHLYKGIQEFYGVFPEVRDRPLFITGESYAGKHIPSFANEIYSMKDSNEPKINLKGFAIGNPFIDPPGNVAYSEIGSVLGLVDTPTIRTMKRFEAAIDVLVKKGQMRHAQALMSTNLYLFMRSANYSNIYNLLKPHESALEADFIDFVQTPESRAALHVGDVPFKNIGKVYEVLIPDFMNSGMHYLKTLIGQYPILLYSGHMDIIVAYPFTRRVVEAFSGPCPHDPWFVGGRLAGYKHKCGDLELALVHTAGHMVPTDQPEAAIDLISEFIERALHGP